MNRNLLKLQKIKEANQSLENRYLIKEQAPPPPPPAAAPSTPPPAPAPAPITTTPPPSDPNTPKKLTPEQEKDLKERLKKDEVMSCSLDKGTKSQLVEIYNERLNQLV